MLLQASLLLNSVFARRRRSLHSIRHILWCRRRNRPSDRYYNLPSYICCAFVDSTLAHMRSSFPDRFLWTSVALQIRRRSVPLRLQFILHVLILIAVSDHSYHLSLPREQKRRLRGSVTTRDAILVLERIFILQFQSEICLPIYDVKILSLQSTAYLSAVPY